MGSFVVILSTPLLTQHLGLGAAAAGAWLFAAQAAFLVGSLAAGWALDHYRKTWILAITLLANAAAFFTGAYTTRVVLVGGSLILGYFFHGAWRPSMIAIAADETAENDHAVAFSLMYFVHNIGYLVAPVAAGILFAWNPKSVFAADAASSVLSAAVVLVGTGTALRAFRPAAPAAPVHETGDHGFIATILRDRPLLLFSAAFVLVQFTYAQVAFALPLTTIARLGEHGTEAYGWIMAANAGIVLALAPPLTALTRRWNAVTAIALTAALYLVGFGALVFVRTLPFLFLSALVWTTGEVLMAIHINVFVSQRAPRHLRGRYLSALRAVFATGKILAPAVGGVVVELWSVDAVWVLTSTLCGVAIGAFMLVRRHTAGDPLPEH
jgi:MFS family permease